MNDGLWVLAGFAAGSLPTGYLMGRALKGIDIRTVGSGNVGATNVFRSVGRGAGVATLLIDILKGFLPVWGALRGLPVEAVPLLTGAAAVAGHTWSPWVRFRGGKGVATSAGVFLALLPGPMGVALLVFALAFALSRRVSVGSLAGAVVLPLAAWFAGAPPAREAMAVALCLVVVLRHIPNIKRLARGEEPPLFGLKKGDPKSL
jgi:glycerol-3-phosphate acyltransferase PlsY